MYRPYDLLFRRIVVALTIISQILSPLYYAGVLNWHTVRASEMNRNNPIVTNTSILPPVSVWDIGEAASIGQDPVERNISLDANNISPQAGTPNYNYGTKVVEEQAWIAQNDRSAAARVEITESHNLLGQENNQVTRVFNNSHANGTSGVNWSCIVVTFDGTITLNNGSVRALAWRDPSTQGLELRIAVSDQVLGCTDETGWVGITMLPTYEVSSTTPTWYGSNYTGTIRSVRLKIWTDQNNPLHSGRAMFIDAVRLYGTFTPDDKIDEEQTAGDKNCSPCNDANTAGQTQVEVGRPVNPLTGNYTYSVDDLMVQGVGQPLVFRRTYSAHKWQQFNAPGDNLFALGPGWTHNYNMRLVFDSFGGRFVDGDGSTHRFVAAYDLNGNPTYTFEEGFLATLTRATVPDGYEYILILRNQTRYKFLQTNDNVMAARITQIDTVSTTLPAWNPIVISYDSLRRIERISSGSRYLAFTYDGDTVDAHISEVYDHRGGCAAGAPCVRYQYTNYYPNDPFGLNYLDWRLTSVTDLRGKTWTYVYGIHPNTPDVGLANLTKALDPLGNIIEQQSYSIVNQVASQWNGANELIASFNQVDTQTVRVTDGRGNTLIYRYDANGALASIHLDDPVLGEQPLSARDHSAAQYRPVTETIGSNNVTMNWSSDGYTLASMTVGSGTADAATTSYTYGSYSNLTSITAPGNRLTQYEYNNAAFPTLPTAVVDALNHRTEFTYTSNGFLETIINADGKVTRYSYDAYGQRTEMMVNYVAGQPGTSDQNLRTRFVYDDTGRLILSQDPFGRCDATLYDPAGNVTRTVRNFSPCNPDEAWQTIVSAVQSVTHNSLTPDSNITTNIEYDDAGRRVRVTDTIGRVTVYEYDGDSRVSRVVRNYMGIGVYSAAVPDENVSTSYTYDAAGNVTTITDVLSRRDWICYDALNRPNRLVKNATGNGGSPTTDPCNAASYGPSSDNDKDVITTLAYDLNSNVIDIYHPDGTQTKFLYDALNRQKAMVQNYQDGVHVYDGSEPPDQDVITLTFYDEVGNISRTVDPASRVTVMCYDKLNRQTRTIVNIDTDDSSQYLPLTDLCVPNLDRAAYPATDRYLVTDMIYDSLGRVSETIDPLGRKTTFQYDAVGRVTRQIKNHVDGIASDVPDEDVIVETSYDAAGRVVEIAEVYVEGGQQKRRLTCLEYDAFDRQTATLSNCQPGVPASPDINVRQSSTYDSVGRVSSQTDPNNHTISFVYDRLDRLVQLTDPLGHSTTTVYDGLGNILSVTDPISHATHFSYDQLNRQTETLTDLGFRTSITYDRMGRVTGRTDANSIQTWYAYDHLGRLTQVLENFSSVHPINDPANPDRNVQTTYTYDIAGNVLTIGLPGGTSVSYGYDHLNRRTQINGSLSGDIDIWGMTYDKGGRVVASSAPNGQTQALSYDGFDRLEIIDYSDQATADVSFIYDTLGRRIQMADGLGTTQYRYDALDRITQLSDPLSQTLAYQYDAAGRRVGLNLPGSRALQYIYDDANRLMQVSDWDATTSDVTYSYDNANRITGMSLPNGVLTDYTYDNDNRLTGMRYQQTAQTQLQFDYSLDNVGNRLSVTEQQLNANHPPIANAGSDQVVTDSDNSGSEIVTLDGSGSSDSDGTIVSYEWTEAGTLIATGVNPQVTLVVGSHTITLTVTDDADATSTDTVLITVNPAPVTNTPTPLPTDTLTPTATNTSSPTPTYTPSPTPTVTNTPTATTTSSGPTMVTGQVSSSSDDVNEANTSFTPNASTIWIGNAGTTNPTSYTGLRFTNLAIPPGATITSAYLEVHSSTSQWIIMQFSIAAEAADNSATFSSGSRPSQRTQTTAKVQHNSDTNWNANTWYSLNEMASVIQEVVNRPGWQSGNSISIILQGPGSGSWGRKFVTAFDGSAEYAPKLVITYTDGSPIIPTTSATETPTAALTITATSTPTATLTHTPMATVTSTATLTPTASDTPTATYIPSITPTSSSVFPSTSVLDTFNRANGSLGGNWSGATGGYAIVNQQVDVNSGDAIYWNVSSFGPAQEVFVTLVTIDPASDEVDLILKRRSDNSMIEVWYTPALGRVQVWTNTPQQGWQQQGGDIPVTFVAGDQFGARALADGTVGVYRNGVLLGQRNVSAWPYYASGGQIGLWFINSGNSVLDDFGGGSTSATTLSFMAASEAGDTITDAEMQPAIPFTETNSSAETVHYEETQAGIRYTGQWYDYAGAKSSGGTLRYTNDPSATIDFDFVGESVTLYFSRRPDGGQKVICVDVACQLADFRSTTIEWQQAVSFTGLQAGDHHVQIRNIGTSYGDLDAVQVFGAGAAIIEQTVASIPMPTATAISTATPLPASLPFVETFDSGLGWNTSGAWLLDTQTAFSGTGWFADSTQRDQISALVYGGAIDLRTAAHPQLIFWQKVQLASVDRLVVEVKLDGTDAWQPVGLQLGFAADWQAHVIDLSGYTGQIIRLRLRLEALGPVPEAETTVGYWLDELSIQDILPTVTPTGEIIATPTAAPTDVIERTPEATATVELILTETPTETLLPTLTETPVSLETAAPIDLATVEPAETESSVWFGGGKPVFFQLDTEVTAEPTAADAPLPTLEIATPTLSPTPEAVLPTAEAPTAVPTETATPTEDGSIVPTVEATLEVTPEVTAEATLELTAEATPEAGLTLEMAALAAPPPSRTIAYRYDNLYRLLEADYCDGQVSRDQCLHQTANITRSYDYSYDLRGNRTNVSIFDGVDTINSVYTYNSANQIVTAQTGSDPLLNFAYDPNGNLTSDGINSYAYDAANRLVTYTANAGLPEQVFHSYTYNGLGDRYRQTVDGVQTRYLLDLNSSLTQVVGEFKPGDDTYYLLGLDVIGQQQNGTWSYFGYDGLGSVRQMTNDAGVVGYTASYDPYGQLLEQDGTLGSSLGFTGEQTDASGLLYLRARYANLAIGTFLSRDPVLGVPGLSLSYNGYLYVHGNPVNLTDPSGQIIPIAAILLGAAAGAAISTVLEVGSQMLQGRSIDCLDMGSVGRAALEGAVMGGIGGGVGAVLKTAVKAGQITRRAAALYSAAADISTGVIWDMAVYQETPSDALVRNVAAFGVGTAAGAVSERLLRSAKGVGRWLRGADDDVARAMRQAGDSGGMRAARRPGAEAPVDLSQQRVWYADDKPYIRYGELDEYGRPTLVTAHLDPAKLAKGAKIQHWDSPEFNNRIHDRTHLVAKEFGGGGGANNRVIGYRWINQYGGPMREFEIKVRDAIQNGEIIQYAVKPFYPPGSRTFIPEYIAMEAYGSRGTHLIEVIPNVPR